MANLLRKKLALKRKSMRKDRKDDNKFEAKLNKIINQKT
ncbi:MAG: hypothetical protein BJBARM4_0004 [Candidatus Parvarchaeum acidiphilum ARMAN-4]|jgi:hypothetical protein|uniref:Uncharacterized protein n=1 Tax=Candidatus Parvarchaeum acidiphilum ARMAN-4 TaxID=662760 RepID=D2EE72_PARA4|nr:MAG: hypothetical protein BJBARM4_0004 [Candidatus Parvarchaeum acidiphilum ARMAN-4]